MARRKKSNCFVELQEAGFAPLEPRKPNLPEALDEARALSETSDGAVMVLVGCDKTTSRRKTSRGYVKVGQGSRRSVIKRSVFTCRDGKCRFSRGSWDDRLDE